MISSFSILTCQRINNSGLITVRDDNDGLILGYFLEINFNPQRPISFSLFWYIVDCNIVHSNLTGNLGLVKNQLIWSQNCHQMNCLEIITIPMAVGFFLATIGTNGIGIVFNGIQPLVKPWNGNDPLLWFKQWSFSKALNLIFLIIR